MSKKSPITQAVQQIAEEKGIPVESIVETIAVALAAAYRKDFGKKNQNIQVEFDLESGSSKVFDVKTVSDKPLRPKEPEESKEAETKSQPTKLSEKSEARGEKKKEKEDKKEKGEEGLEAAEAEAVEEEKIEYLDEKTEISVAAAQEQKPGAKVGDILSTSLPVPEEYGRMAAQTAKQVIIQRLREIEREALFNEYKGKEGQILNGIVQRQEGKIVLVDLGQATAIIPPQEQIEGERYDSGQRIRVYLVAVNKGHKGPELLASRSHPEMVRKLFQVEVPEIASGTVEIKGIAREAGRRSKVAVATKDSNIDPIGSCVGQRGTRVQTVISELGGEKIDIIEWSEDPIKFITNALSPAKVIAVKLNEAEKSARVEVREDQLSLAIGRSGQNVRLASKLSGWRIDVVGEKPAVSSPKTKAAKPEAAKATDSEEAGAEKPQEPAKTEAKPEAEVKADKIAKAKKPPAKAEEAKKAEVKEPGTEEKKKIVKV